MIAPSEKAVKATYADTHWHQDQFEAQIQQARSQLQVLDRPRRDVVPGRYRTYFAPAALADLVGMLSWGAVSEASLQQGGSALGKLREGKTLSPLLSLREDFTHGTVPRFNSHGEVAPEVLPILADGKLVNTLINARTAKEYDLTSTAANGSESLRAPEVAVGTLPPEAVLSALGTGLYLSNLHYLNWSDRSGGRITGMTRYACFWVENGEIVAPIQDLRFDESLYAFWGDNLEALTTHAEFVPDVDTYDMRSLGGTRVPGMLVNAFTFTL
nr:metallopeptidase TldD-related protein [Petrachloros mirabilis]